MKSVAAVLLLLGAGFGLTSAAYNATLTGASVIPPVDTTAHGYAVFTLSPDGKSYDWELHLFDLVEATMAHIHLGNKSTLNGPGLFGLVPVGAPVSEYENGNLPMLHPPVNGTQVFTGSFDASDYLPAYQGKDLDYLTELFKTGGAYVNAHSVKYPVSYIRGEVQPIA